MRDSSDGLVVSGDLKEDPDMSEFFFFSLRASAYSHLSALPLSKVT